MIANDNWLEFTLRYLVDYKKRRATKDQLFEHIIAQVERSDGKVAIASTTVQLVDPPAFNIAISDRRVQS